MLVVLFLLHIYMYIYFKDVFPSYLASCYVWQFNAYNRVSLFTVHFGNRNKTFCSCRRSTWSIVRYIQFTNTLSTWGTFHMQQVKLGRALTSNLYKFNGYKMRFSRCAHKQLPLFWSSSEFVFLFLSCSLEPS